MDPFFQGYDFEVTRLLLTDKLSLVLIRRNGVFDHSCSASTAAVIIIKDDVGCNNNSCNNCKLSISAQ